MKKWVAIIMILTLTLLFKVNVIASTSTVKNYLIGDDKILNGVESSSIIYFYVDKNWIMSKDPYFELSYVKSQEDTTKQSTISILINDIPIYSEFIKNKKLQKINIPVKYILEGYNKLEIKSYNRITDDLCGDDENPGNWLTIDKDSYINIEYEYKNKNISLKNFPYPYLKTGRAQVNDNVIMINQIPSEQEIRAVAMLSAIFGSKEKFANINTQIDYIDNINKYDTNIIYISETNNLSQDYKKYFGQEDKNTAVIKQIVNESNNKKILFIIFNNETAMENALISLLDENILKQLDDYEIISNELKIPIKEQKKSNITLKELGYSETLLEGLSEGEVSYDIRIPSSWELQESANIILKYRYSKAIDFDKSIVTILINNIPIGSKQLDEEKANDDIIQINIPKEFLNDKIYNISFKFNMYLKDLECAARVDKNVWAYVLDTTTINLPHQNKKNYSLENYQSNFIKNNEFDDLVFIIPSNPTKVQINSVCDISAYIGHEIKYIDRMYVKKTDNLTEELLTNNIILISSVENGYELIKNVNEHLHIKYEEDSHKIQSSDKITLIEDTRTYAASIQVVKLPENQKKALLAVTSTKDMQLNNAVEYLTNSKYAAELIGKVAVMNENGIINSVDIQRQNEKNNVQEETNIPEEDAKEEIKIRESKQTNFIIFSISIIGMIMISIISIIIKKKR